jgi:hypothetical protein
MAWRINDLVHLHLTNTKLSDLQSELDSLNLLDKVLSDVENDYFWLTFSPQYTEVYNLFNEVVRKDFKRVTTYGQVREFVEICFSRFYEKSNEQLDLDDMLYVVCSSELSEDTIVLIEFED